MSALHVARVCVELDVSKPIPSKIWANLAEDKGFYQEILVEGSIAYCTRCRMHGHDLSKCNKAAKAAERARAIEVAKAQKGIEAPKENKEEWIEVKKRGRKTSSNNYSDEGQAPKSVSITSSHLMMLQDNIDGESSHMHSGSSAITPATHKETDIENPADHDAKDVQESITVDLEGTSKPHIALDISQGDNINKISSANTNSNEYVQEKDQHRRELTTSKDDQGNKSTETSSLFGNNITGDKVGGTSVHDQSDKIMDPKTFQRKVQNLKYKVSKLPFKKDLNRENENHNSSNQSTNVYRTEEASSIQPSSTQGYSTSSHY